MKRLFTILSGFSLVLCILSVVVSHFFYMTPQILIPCAGTQYGVQFKYQGDLRFNWATPLTSSVSQAPKLLFIHFAGTQLTRGAAVDATGKLLYLSWYVIIPVWQISLLLLNLPLIWLLIRTRRFLVLRRRRKNGLCLQCGYNLTGNVSGVCPECGTSIPDDLVKKALA